VIARTPAPKDGAGALIFRLSRKNRFLRQTDCDGTERLSVKLQGGRAFFA
jgi:hypothetical protein